MFYIFFEAPDWAHELRYRHEVMLEIIALASRLGIRFAFPTQTLHIESMPLKGVEPHQYTPVTEQTKNELEAFLGGGPDPATK